jgi:hypothetical protein
MVEGNQWDRKFQLNIGSWTLGLARAGLGFVQLEPEARAAVGAVREAEVAMYELRGEADDLNLAKMLSTADQAMGSREWDRVVGVMSRDNMVAVYVPRSLPSARDLRVCVAVVDGRNMIVVSGRSNLEPLLELASERFPEVAREAGIIFEDHGLDIRGVRLSK